MIRTKYTLIAPVDQDKNVLGQRLVIKSIWQQAWELVWGGAKNLLALVGFVYLVGWLWG